MIQNFAEVEIALPAAKLFDIGPLPVTNTMLMGALGVIVMFAVLIYARNNVIKGKHNVLTGLVQWSVEGMYSQVLSIIPNKKVAKSIAPLALSIFFTVLFTYWISIIPGVGESIFVKATGAPLLRGLPTDLNFTFALAIITIVAVQFYAIKSHGFFGNAGRYFINPLKNPIGAFEGLLELVGEFSRLIALSLRLFGNAFAGEVLLAIIAMLSGWFAGLSLPFFMAFELFIGFIQAYVFFVLTCIFAALGTASHGHSDSAHSDDTLAKSEGVS